MSSFDLSALLLLACVGVSSSCGGGRSTPPAEPPSSGGAASENNAPAGHYAVAEAEPETDHASDAKIAAEAGRIGADQTREDPSEGLRGDSLGEAYVGGGLGLAGTGEGGGGTGEGTIGLGNSGLIGKGGGGGTGTGYGSGSGSGFGGSGEAVPRVRQAQAEVQGALDKDIIRRIVRAHINQVRYCYNEGLQKDPKLAGRLSVEFVIGPSGSVTSAKVESSELKDAKVADCVAKAIRTWKFPAPNGGGQVKVSYPFSLTPG